MSWQTTPTGKLRHLRDYAERQRAQDRRMAGEEYQRGFRDCATNFLHHVETLLEQIARGV